MELAVSKQETDGLRVWLEGAMVENVREEWDQPFSNVPCSVAEVSGDGDCLRGYPKRAVFKADPENSVLTW